MSLSPRQKELQQQAQSAHQKWETRLDETKDRMLVVHPVLVILTLLLGGAGGHYFFGQTAPNPDMPGPLAVVDGNLTFLIITLSVGLPIMILGLVLKIRLEQARVSQDRRTEQTVGLVVDYDVSSYAMGENNVPGHALILELDYEVDGQAYRKKIQPSEIYSNFPGTLDRQRKRHPLGSEIELAYDPEDPSDCGVIVGRGTVTIGSRLAGLGFYLGIAALGAFAVNFGWVLVTIFKTMP